MSQRIVIGLHVDADGGKIVEALKREGAINVRPPSGIQPDVIVAEVPDVAKVREVLDGARRIPGVRYAETDAWRMTE